MAWRFFRAVIKLISGSRKNSRGQGVLETQLVTILFFTVTAFGIIDLANITFLELKAFEASFMCCRIAVVSGASQAQTAALQMFPVVLAPYVKLETANPPGQNYDNGMRRCTLRFFYIQKIMFPGLLQPVFDVASARNSDTLDPYIILDGWGMSIVDFIGPSSFLNGYYYSFKNTGGEMFHPTLGVIPAGYEWMKMMGYPGHGPYTF